MIWPCAAIMRTIAVILVSTLLDREPHAPRVPFAGPSAQTAGANGSHSTTAHPTKPFGEALIVARDAGALPNHLFWTWFVDNRRPLLATKSVL